MNLEHALSELEGSQPLAAVEFMIAHPDQAESVLLARLKQAVAASGTLAEIALSPPHPLLARVHLTLPRRRTNASRETIRRFVIALGAMRSEPAIPVLLELLVRFPMDAKLGEGLGWALANIGEGAVLPTYSFARRHDKPMPGRAVAMVALGYIADPRVPTILSNLWGEYCTSEPRLALAALIGLSIHGEEASARAHATQMEQLWQAHGRNRAAWTEDLRAAAASLAHALDNVRPVKALPLWRDVLQVIG